MGRHRRPRHWFVSNRDDLGASPAIRIAGRAALDLAGVGVDDLAHVDLYSCFPSRGADRRRPSSGSASTARSPSPAGFASPAGRGTTTSATRSPRWWSASASDAGSLGLVTANGGYLTKHAFGVYSTEPPPQAWRHARPQDEVDALPRRELAEVVDDVVTVESTVVDARPRGRARGGDRRRPARRRPPGLGATPADADAMARMITEETAGDPGRIAPDGAFTFV